MGTDNDVDVAQLIAEEWRKSNELLSDLLRFAREELNAIARVLELIRTTGQADVARLQSWELRTVGLNSLIDAILNESSMRGRFAELGMNNEKRIALEVDTAKLFARFRAVRQLQTKGE